MEKFWKKLMALIVGKIGFLPLSKVKCYLLFENEMETEVFSTS